MGAAGQARARQVFDWAAIIPQYQALWQEQQTIRKAAILNKDREVPVPNPRYMEPLQAFRAWPTSTFSPSQRLKPELEPPTDDIVCLLNFTAAALPSPLHKEEILRLIHELRRRGEASAQELLDILEPSSREAGVQVVLWLMRAGLINAS
jgi:hypothetical protein